MTKVLFVCLGNICRSPMAEAIFRHKVTEAGLEDNFEIASRATGSWNLGNAPHEGTRAILDDNQISYQGMKAELIQPEDFENFDVILGMDEQNIRDLKAVSSKEYHHKIHLLLSVVENRETTEVPDPYYTGNFDYTYELIDQSTSLWLDKLS